MIFPYFASTDVFERCIISQVYFRVAVEERAAAKEEEEVVVVGPFHR
jgi:hypothetical protein